MKVLFLFTRPLFPLNTGAKIRTFNLLKGVAQYHDVTFATFAPTPSEVEALKQMEPFCKRILHLKSKKFSNFQLIYLLIRNFFSKRPLTIQKYWSKPAMRQIDAEMKREKFDLIHCDQPHMAPYVERFTQVPRLLNEHNIESQITRRYAEKSRGWLKKKFLMWQWRKMETYERSLWRSFDRVSVVSQVDMDTLLAYEPDTCVVEIPNGVDTEFFTNRNEKEEPQSLLFTGSMDWLPNEDAVLYFCEYMWLQIRAQFPNAQFYIVGRNPGPKIRALTNIPGIVVTGTVNDVRPYLELSSVFIVPLRIGGGSRLKILEALSMKKKVISTTIGCEGLEVTPDEDILIADSPQQFVNQIAELWSNSEKGKSLGEMGRMLVLQQYDWSIIAQKLNQVYLEITAEN